MGISWHSLLFSVRLMVCLVSYRVILTQGTSFSRCRFGGSLFSPRYMSCPCSHHTPSPPWPGVAVVGMAVTHMASVCAVVVVSLPCTGEVGCSDPDNGLGRST